MQQFLVNLIVEVVQRYPVDGIQLDDHFGLPIEFGYDPYTIKLYQNGHSGVGIILSLGITMSFGRRAIAWSKGAGMFQNDC